MSPEIRGRSVAFFTPSWPPGHVQNGIATYVGHIVSALSKLGVETHVVTSSEVSLGRDSASVDLTKIPVPRARRALFRAINNIARVPTTGLSFGWSIAAGLAEVESQHGLDLVEMEETFGAAWYVQEVISAPVVVRLHGPWFVNGVALGVPEDREFRTRDRLERRCIADAWGVTSPSRDLLDRVRARYDLPLSNAAVIPNPAPHVPIERRWSLETSDKKTVLFVGRFDRHKGGDVMIDAFRELAEAIPNVELLFVGPDRGLRDDAGKTHDLPSYLDRRLTPEIKSRVHVRGAMPGDEIEKLRRQAFVTVVPSRYENFSLALVEALSFGCPTVASAVGGNGEILLADRNGLSFESGNPSDLAARMLHLFRDPFRAAALGEWAAVDMAQRLAPESLARSTLNYYETIWRAARRRPRVRRSFHRAFYSLSGLG